MRLYCSVKISSVAPVYFCLFCVHFLRTCKSSHGAGLTLGQFTFIPTESLGRGEGGRSGTVGGRSLGCFFWVLCKRIFPKPDQHIEDVIQQESLGTDMLYELKDSNYTRYHIELINRSRGGRLGASIITLSLTYPFPFWFHR